MFLALLLASLSSSLDPYSLTQQLAYYELYPDAQEGQACLQRAAELLGQPLEFAPLLPDLQLLIKRFTTPIGAVETELSDRKLALIDRLGSNFGNRALKGHHVWTVDELLALQPEEIDLARGLLLTLLGEDNRTSILNYEALLDVMALQVQARKPTDTIDAINQLLFFELGFRFPPQSRCEEQIDAFTFLPSVMEARRGVCLGVSCLYLCLAQRLGLSLEAVTPPGHIYVRYPTEDGVLNIETTARGVHVAEDEYLGLETTHLESRNLKEVIGLTFMNQGAALWQAHDREGAIAAYRKALAFLPEDPLAKEFLAYNLLAVAKRDEGHALLTEVRAAPDPPTVVIDFLDGHTDLAGIDAVFQPMGTTRTSILNKRDALQRTLEQHPKFRAGWLQLALTWLELGRQHEALCALKQLHALDRTEPVVEYLLAAISLERHDLPSAWTHLQQAEAVATNPRPLIPLRRALKLRCPPPALVD